MIALRVLLEAGICQPNELYQMLENARTCVFSSDSSALLTSKVNVPGGIEKYGTCRKKRCMFGNIFRGDAWDIRYSIDRRYTV